jgi:hypothetical protein
VVTRRRFDDGLARLLRRLRRAGKQVVCLGRFALFPPGDRRLLLERAETEGAVAVGSKRLREEGTAKAKTQGESVGEGSAVLPEEQRFEERLLGPLALADAYRACHPREIDGDWTLRT